MTKALIFGLGGVGAVYGWILEHAGVEVTAVCRSNYDVVKQEGITIRSKIFGSVQAKPRAVSTVIDAAVHGPFDYVIVCSKAFPGTSVMIKDAVTAETAIVLAQNGIGIEDEYAHAYPSNAIISGVVYCPATQVELGVVEMGPLERFEIGTYPATAPPAAKAKAEQLSQLWQEGGATCPVFDDVQGQRWIKVSVNAAWNSMTALTLCDDANLLRSSDAAEDMIFKVMKQVALIAKAAGHDVVTEEVIQHQIDRPRERLETGGKEPSMLTDVRFGRALEVEAILGNTVRIARELKVEVPYLELLYVLTKGLDFAIAKSGGWRPIARH